MADYKIKFEYKGIGKQASGIRQKVLQAQKGGKKTGDNTAGARETITSLKTLNSSILKLIASNRDLSNSLKMGGGRPGGPGGSPLGGGSAGFGKIGAAIPILGAGIAALGFTIQKVNQVGNAYIQKVNQQFGTMGVGGFQGAAGVYTGAERGAGMAAYARSTGKFSKSGAAVPQTALDIGTIFGQAPSESLLTAGQFKRAGAGYNQAAFVGAGAGIETELPTLLTGMASILTDAVREGVNTSDMSSDMAREVSALTMATPGKSVEAALNIVKSFKGVKQNVASGKVGSVQGLYTTEATQEMLMEKLSGKGGTDYRRRLVNEGFLSFKQAKASEGARTFEDLQQAMPKGVWSLTRKFAAEVGPAALQKRAYGNLVKQFGDTEEGRQGAYDFALSHGWVESQAQLETLGRSARGELPEDVEAIGKKKITGKAGVVKGAAIGKKQLVAREALIMEHGATFADASLKMETAMMTIADKAAPLAITGITSVGNAAIGLAKQLSTLNDMIESSKTAKKTIDVLKHASPAGLLMKGYEYLSK